MVALILSVNQSVKGVFSGIRLVEGLVPDLLLLMRPFQPKHQPPMPRRHHHHQQGDLL